MKVVVAIFAAFSLALASAEVTVGDRTIARVVKLLQDMLDTSKADGDDERTRYGKYKCYCDQNEAEKEASIDSLTKQIGLLGSEIEALQQSNGELSREAEQLAADKKANRKAREDAESLRQQENQDFVALERDSKDAIRQMGEAIEVLASVGADQTLAAAAADHMHYMSNFTGLIRLRSTVKQALVAASASVTTKQARVVESFLQAPFTGTYTSQAGEVVGILKDMRDTFESNLASATAAETSAAEAYTKWKEAKEREHTLMSKRFRDVRSNLSGNDGDLATKKGQKSSAESTKADDEQFLASLLEMCAATAKEYDQRTLLRRNEEAALAEAIAILNSDAAFETFGAVSATKTGATSFLQGKLVRKHTEAAAPQMDDKRQRAQKLLRKASKGSGSFALSKIAALLEANNPFTVVLQEIQKMIALIAKEQQADKEQFDWCESERSSNNADLLQKEAQITSLEGNIAKLDEEIKHPETGLRFQISETQANLVSNSESQTTETAIRTEANAAYQKDVEHLVDAEQLLVGALSVLQTYYAKIVKVEGPAFAQADPSPPAPWTGAYAGQSGKGSDAISMLKFILENTKQEEAQAHKEEAAAQQAYEGSMSMLKDSEASLQATLSRLEEELAVKQQELIQKNADLKITVAQKEMIEAYLLKIKPSCDFIVQQFTSRTSKRSVETQALKDATAALKGTPAYLTAVSAAHSESLGDCLGKCAGAEETALCKACLAKVTVPGYCAGHPEAVGC